MEEMIRQIRAALNEKIYYLALFGALTLPDICGALESVNGQSTEARYKDWFRANVPEYRNSADLIYGLRCSFLHQGSAIPHKNPYPVAFMYPSPSVDQFDNFSTEINGDAVEWIGIPSFVEAVCRATEAWFTRSGTSGNVPNNLSKFVRYRPEGFPPHVSSPVIA